MNGHKFPRTWECVSENTFRLKVYGGWFVRETLMLISGDKRAATSIALQFYNDPEHDWVLENEK